MSFQFRGLQRMTGNIHHGQAIMMANGYGEEARDSWVSLTLGSTDCKNNLLGILDALEFLLEHNFEPKRTILAGFGFDEEIRLLHIYALLIVVVHKVRHIFPIIF